MQRASAHPEGQDRQGGRGTGAPESGSEQHDRPALRGKRTCLRARVLAVPAAEAGAGHPGQTGALWAQAVGQLLEAQEWRL